VILGKRGILQVERKFNYEIMTEIKERWSPRAFSEKAAQPKTGAL